MASPGLYNLNSNYGRLVASALAGVNPTPGKFFLVANSSNSNINDIDGLFVPDAEGIARRYSTVDAAINACTANDNDVILIAPGHTETISSASGVTSDVAGVTIVGLGNGADRPKYTFSATDSTWVVSGASTVIKNIVVAPSIDSVVSPFVVSGADCTLGIEVQDASAAIECVRAVLTTAAANRLKLNLKYAGFTAGNACVNAVRLVGGTGAEINVDFYGVASTAIVEFHTTAVVDCKINGYFYNSGTTNLSKNVVDTVTGSTWFVKGEDGAAGASFEGGSGNAIAVGDLSAIASDVSAILVDTGTTLPATLTTIDANQDAGVADAVTNDLARDVVGNKTDAAVTAVGTTKSIAAYAKGLVTMNTVQSADSVNNAFAGDVVGNKTDASVYVPGTTKSIAAYAKGTADLQERVVASATAVMADNDVLFTIAGGPIKIEALWSECITTNDATASTVVYKCTPTTGSEQTISGASASLANAAAGASIALAGTALATAALYNANGPNLIANPGTVVAPAGTIAIDVAVGSTTGTWKHYLRYKPLAAGVTVT